MRKTSLGIIGSVLGVTVVALTTLVNIPSAFAAGPSYPVVLALEGVPPNGPITGALTITCSDLNQTKTVSGLALPSSGGSITMDNPIGGLGLCSYSATLTGAANTIDANNKPWVSLQLGSTTVNGPTQVSAYGTPFASGSIAPIADGTTITIRVHYDNPGVGPGTLAVPVQAVGRNSPTAGATSVNVAVNCNGEQRDRTFAFSSGGPASVFMANPQTLQPQCSATVTVHGPGSSASDNFLWIEYGTAITPGAKTSQVTGGPVFVNGGVFTAVISGSAQPTTTTQATTTSTSTTTTTTTTAPTTTSVAATTTTAATGGSTTSTVAGASTTSTSSTSTSTTIGSFGQPSSNSSATGTVPAGSSNVTTTILAGGTTTTSTTRPGATTTTVKAGATPLAGDPGLAVATAKPGGATAVTQPPVSLATDDSTTKTATKSGSAKFKTVFKTVRQCKTVKKKKTCKNVRVAVRVKVSH